MHPVTSANPSTRLRMRYGPKTQLGFWPIHEQVHLSRLTVQKPPYNVNTTLSVNAVKVLSGSDSRPQAYISIDDGDYPGTYLRKVAYNKAYQKLMDDVNSDQSQLAATLAEAQKSAETVNNRAQWLWSFTNRKANRRNWRNKHRDLAALFIEYRWVYEATVNDIWSAVDFLQRFQPKVEVIGGGRARDSWITSNPAPYPPYYKIVDYNRYEESARCKITSLCKISNPNLFFAQQMGLTNLPALAWELTKFSWLADWFGTLGEVLNSWDDRLGLEFVNPCLVDHREMVRTNIISVRGPDGYTRQSVVRRVAIDRDPTIGPGPYLIARQIKGPSLVRGATAISLLTQLLGRK